MRYEHAVSDGRRDAFSRDVLWNVGSLAVAGGCGLLLNFLVSLVYGAAALGVFNQVYAVYILFSQVAALGFQYSVLKYLAANDDADERRAIMTSALAASGVIATVCALAAWAAADFAGAALDSADVARGIRYAAPGVALFALSKITLGALNALQRMRLYALFFGGRFVLMIAAFGGCVALDVDVAVLPVVLTVAEGVTFLGSLMPLLGLVGRVPGASWRSWTREHVRFGVKGFMSGMLSELNTRVDVLILGAFTNDVVVGAYSFAAILAEGVFQIFTVLRTNYAPILIRLWAAKDRVALLATIRRGRNRTYLAALAAGAALIAGYALFVPLVTAEPELRASSVYFAALVAGMVASAGYQPFHFLLIYAGFPGWHTWLMLAIVVCNAIGNVILIAAIGPVGSAMATGATFVLGALILRVMVSRKMDLSI